jgi:hypothetical protein
MGLARLGNSAGRDHFICLEGRINEETCLSCTMQQTTMIHFDNKLHLLHFTSYTLLIMN